MNDPGSHYPLREKISPVEVAQNVLPKERQKLPGSPSQLQDLAVVYNDKFKTSRNIEDLETALQLFRAALDKTPPGDDKRAHRLHALADAYYVRHQSTKSRVDVDKAIELFQEALALTPSDHPAQAFRLQCLGTMYGSRYYKTLDMADIDKAIQLLEESLNKTSVDHPNLADRKFVLGCGYKDRFPRSRKMTDIDKAVRLLEEAIQQTPLGHAYREPRLHVLGHSYEYRYYSKWDIEDLRLSIQCFQESLDKMPLDHPLRPSRLSLLGCKYRDKFQATMEKTDIEKAIERLQEALHQTPLDHPDRPSRLEEIANAYGCRYHLNRDAKDLDLSIQSIEESLEKTPSDHPDRATRLQTLGAGYQYRSGQKGSLEDLSDAIRLYYASLNITSPDDPHRVSRLVCLGAAYETRFRMIGAVADIDAAIYLFKESVGKTPPNHPELADRLQWLGNAHECRYLRKGDDEDFKLAVQSQQKSLEITAPQDPRKGSRLLELAIVYRDHFGRARNREHLERCIQLCQESPDITPSDDRSKPLRLCILGTGYALRYDITRAATDVQMALRVLEDAVRITKPDDPNSAFRLNLLGSTYKNRYRDTRNKDDLDMAIQRLQASLDHTQSGTQHRLSAGMTLYGLYVEVKDWAKAYQAASKAVHLVPRLTSRSLENADKQNKLREVVGLAGDAAAIALNAGKNAFEALQILELGRGVITGSLSELRTDLRDLQNHHPDLANEYVHLCQQLDPPPTLVQAPGIQQRGFDHWLADLRTEQHLPAIRELSRVEKSRDSSWQGRHELRHDAADNLDKLIREIRNNPGFEDFLLAPVECAVKEAARHGPIVVINVSPLRCDALLIEPHRVRSLALPHLKSHEIEEKARQYNLDSPRVLEWLWDVVANPILTEIRLTQPPSGDDWPRIWWIPTGSLSKFPVHAAGYHSKCSRETVLDRVMSSYSTSIRAIIHSRRNGRSSSPSSTPLKALLVAMPDTPNQKALPFASEEVAMLRALSPSMSLRPVEPKRCKQDVVQELSDCAIFHFAGHGRTDDTDPSQNCLLLSDWEIDPLTVGTLLQMNLRKCSPFLAYLSACGTGRIGNAKFVDESIHLISACQLAGFRHVIGTLWEVNDRLCVDVARVTYEEMRNRTKDGHLADDAICRGLHIAIRQVRERWLNKSAPARCVAGSNEVDKPPAVVEATVRGTGQQARNHDNRFGRDIVSCDEDDEEESTKSLLWVPYVHFGV
ncbi:hypothetical protein Z517_07171 [Fonsecaea pedrosoi CBS 271.37]|uniref:CHAT domain-containing protein n=1 Tax=Fonsecaea pedrosoi CBS 271.37 TaxID=1442368 RepID=A0A0D2GPU8_9EURO|nr:uncharacterized protein Z517_07171 [Fonsecaea pedrosoi CBS 271.37]KIW80555.1 hypothetical protein Z517_07171 [Fonsecaea pedrosoi CBS 271.37]